jgi:hypothetical protein
LIRLPRVEAKFGPQKLILRSKATCNALRIDTIGMWIEEAGRRCRSKEELATGADDAPLAFPVVAEACSDDSARIDVENACPADARIVRQAFEPVAPARVLCTTLTECGLQI